MRYFSRGSAFSYAFTRPQSFGSFTLLTVLFATGFVLAMAPSANAAIGVSAFSITPSTSVKGANPDLAFSATRSGSDTDDLKRAVLKLPAGLNYSLSGVAKCSATDFSRSSCPAASTIGSSILNGKLMLLGATLSAGDVKATLYALSNTQLGASFSIAGFSPIVVRSTITGGAAGGLSLTSDYPRTALLFGGIPLDLTISKLSSIFNAKSGPTKTGATIVTNPTTCGLTDATVTFVPFSGGSASRTASYSTTGCDPVAPDTTITKFADPSTIGSTVQTVEFSGGPAFECRVNAGSWTACVSPWTIPTGSLIDPAQNTYEVRSSNGSGVDGTPAKGYIWFDTRSFTTTSSASAAANAITPAADAQKAGRHPDLLIALASAGSVETKSLSIRFPDGLAFSLAAVPSAQRCSLTEANAGACPASSRIGSLSGLLANPRDGDIAASGSLYLVDSGDSAIPADVMAAIAVELTTPNGLGTARALGHLKLPKTDGSRRLQLDVADVPNTTIASTSSETRLSALRFLARSLTLTLDGDTGGTNGEPAKSLLTNPHYCGSVFSTGSWARPNQKQFVFTATDPNGLPALAATSDYLTVGCNETAFSPSVEMSTVDQAGAPLTTSETAVRLLADIQLPPEAAGVPNATIARTVVQLPPQVNPRFTSYGTSTDQCPFVSTLRPAPPPSYLGFTWFDPISPTTGANLCTNTAARAANSRVGTALITTPLTEQPLQAAVYNLNVSAIPALGIWVDPSIAPTNPKGVSVGLYVKPSTTLYVGGSEGTSLTYEIDSLPDLPITRIQLDLGNNTTRPLGATIFTMASSFDPACVPKPADDPSTPYDDSTAVAANAITRFRPWSVMLDDNWVARSGATYESLLDDPAPGDVEVQSALPITGCVNPEE